MHHGSPMKRKAVKTGSKSMNDVFTKARNELKKLLKKLKQTISQTSFINAKNNQNKWGKQSMSLLIKIQKRPLFLKLNINVIDVHETLSSVNVSKSTEYDRISNKLLKDSASLF